MDIAKNQGRNQRGAKRTEAPPLAKSKFKKITGSSILFVSQRSEVRDMANLWSKID